MTRHRGGTIAAGFVVICMVLTTAAGGALSAGDPQPQEQVGDGPPACSPALPTAPPAVVVRGDYESVQVNIDPFGNNILGDAANEPSIAVDPQNPRRIVIGWRQFDSISSDFREAGWAYSHDSGRTWTFPGVAEEDVFRSDPVLGADADGNIFYCSLTADGWDYSCQMFKSVDGGVSWSGPIEAYGGDKEWMAIDRTGGIGHGNIYTAWDYAGCCGDDWFTRSTDGGMTYLPPVEIPLQPMWGTVTVGPDGAVYVAGRRYADNTKFVCARSSNAQDPAAIPEFDQVELVDMGGALEYYLLDGPNPAGLLGQVWIDADHSGGPYHGTLYMLAPINPPGADPLDTHFTRSTDGGLTWDPPKRINDDPGGTNAWQWYGTLAVAPNGRLHAIFNDTRNSGQDNISELFYCSSDDSGATWSANLPVSPSFDSHLGWPQQNKIGDYYDMVADNLGVNIAYSATFNGEEDVYYLRIGPRLGECDYDGDRDVDLTDLAAWPDCMTGPGPADLGSGCEAFDTDFDADVDLRDFGYFQRVYGAD